MPADDQAYLDAAEAEASSDGGASSGAAASNDTPFVGAFALVALVGLAALVARRRA